MKTPHPNPLKSLRNRRGFTLIEMLVVIAIIALLASITIPSIRRALNSARRTQAASNLRQIGQAFQMYVTDPGNRFNQFPAVVANDGSTHGRPWFIEISPFLQEQAGGAQDLAAYFRCPVYAREYTPSSQTDWNQLGFGMNLYLSGSPSQGWPWQGTEYNSVSYPHRIVEIQNPSGTILLADERGWNFGLHSGNYQNAFQPGRYFHPDQGRLRGLRHGTGANFLFVDGRVTFLRPRDVEPFMF